METSTPPLVEPEDDDGPLMGVDLAMAIALYEPDQCQRCGADAIIGFSGICKACADYLRGEVPA